MGGGELPALVVAFGCAFCAAAGTITETTTDETASGDWEVTVAAGDSNVVTVAQSGKIIKKGGGTLPRTVTDGIAAI